MPTALIRRSVTLRPERCERLTCRTPAVGRIRHGWPVTFSRPHSANAFTTALRSDGGGYGKYPVYLLLR